MPILGQPDTSIYGQTQLWNAPGLAPQGRAGGGQAGPTAAQMKFAADQQTEQDINSLAQQYGDDYDGLVKAVTSVHPDRGLAMGKALEEYRQNAAKTDVENNKVAVSKIDLGTRWLQEAIEDPSKYPVVRARAVSAGGQAIDQILPAPDDPDLQNKLVGVVSAAQPTKDYLETRTKAMQSYMDGNKVDGTLTLLAGSKTPAQWDASTKIVKMGGMGQLLQGIPDAASAQQMLADRQAAGPQKAGTEKGGQAKEGMYKGKRTFGVFDPNTNTFNVDGQQVSAQEFRPIAPQSAGGGGGATPSPTATIEDLAKGSGYSPDGLRKAARAYHESGNLPSLGMGGGKAKQAIQNAEALLYGAEGDLAMSGADFKAKAAALGSMTKQLAAVKAYEGTGLANLKMFTDLAKNIPDTGVPWLNTPLRSLSANVAGSENMAAINAARQVALTEISKVVNNPNLTGSLSDSAREEVLGLIPENATFGQILHVAKVLQKDMSQRPANMQKQIANLRYEMSHPGESAPEETPQQTGAPEQKPIPGIPGGIAELRNGRWIRVK